MRRLLVGYPLTALLLVLAQCSSSDTQRTEPTTRPTAAGLLVTYGPEPTISAKMVCGTEGETELSGALHLAPDRVTTPTWVDHLFGCTYEYPDGSFDVSVKELPTIAATIDYFNSLKAKYTVAQPVALGEDGFMTTDNMSIVRKDNKVLIVDVTKLPAQFGVQSRNRTDMSLTIAITLLGCWTGA